MWYRFRYNNDNNDDDVGGGGGGGGCCLVVGVVVSVLAAYRLNIYLKMLLRIYMYSGSCILYTNEQK